MVGRQFPARDRRLSQEGGDARGRRCDFENAYRFATGFMLKESLRAQYCFGPLAESSVQSLGYAFVCRRHFRLCHAHAELFQLIRYGSYPDRWTGEQSDG